MGEVENWAVWVRQAEVLKAVAHPVRVGVVEFLRDGEQCVCDIAERVGAERSNVSRHLSVMVSAGVLESRKDGLKVMYRLKTPCVVGFLECVREVLKEQARGEMRLLKALR